MTPLSNPTWRNKPPASEAPPTGPPSSTEALMGERGKGGQRNISLLIYFLKSITLTDAHTPVEEQGAERRRRDRLDREVTETVLRV